MSNSRFSIWPVDSRYPLPSDPDFSTPLASFTRPAYCPEVLTGAGALLGVETYPLTVFLSMLLTTSS